MNISEVYVVCDMWGDPAKVFTEREYAVEYARTMRYTPWKMPSVVTLPLTIGRALPASASRLDPSIFEELQES